MRPITASTHGALPEWRGRAAVLEVEDERGSGEGAVTGDGAVT